MLGSFAKHCPLSKPVCASSTAHPSVRNPSYKLHETRKVNGINGVHSLNSKAFLHMIISFGVLGENTTI